MESQIPQPVVDALGRALRARAGKPLGSAQLRAMLNDDLGAMAASNQAVIDRLVRAIDNGVASTLAAGGDEPSARVERAARVWLSNEGDDRPAADMIVTAWHTAMYGPTVGAFDQTGSVAQPTLDDADTAALVSMPPIPPPPLHPDDAGARRSFPPVAPPPQVRPPTPPLPLESRSRVSTLALAVGIVALAAILTAVLLFRGGGSDTVTTASTTTGGSSADPSPSSTAPALPSTAPATAPTATAAPSTAPVVTAPLPTLPAPSLEVELSDGQEIVLDDVDAANFVVSGRTEPGVAVTVNGKAASVAADGRWQVAIPIGEGQNALTAVATRAASPAAQRSVTLIGKFRPKPPPPTVVANPDSLASQYAGPGVALNMGNVFGNDSGPILFSGHTPTSAGSVTVASNGQVTFTPSGNGVYSTTFQYTICASGNSGFCRTATVTLTVQCNLNFPGGRNC